MKLSRRKFVKAGIIAAACAPLLPVRRALAQAGTVDAQLQSSSIVEQLGYYNESTFGPYLNSRFRVYLSPSNTRALELINVSNYPTSLSQLSAMPSLSGDECFSLLFQIPSGKPFTQDTYLIKHDALGTFYMFVVPVGAHNKKSPDYYEAVIYRHQQYSVGKEPTLIVNAPRSGAGAVGKVQTGQNPQLIYGGGALVMQADRSNNSQDAKPDEKVETDVYRFRQVETLAPALSEQTNVAPPPKKTVYPLTLAQSPTINGLRLGMTPEQVLALFPGSKTDKDVQRDLNSPPSRFGVSSFMIKPAKYSTKTKFDRVTQIIFTLFDGRVSTIYVGYDSPVWEHVDEFVTDFSKGRNLPAADEWEAYVGMDTQLKTLNCKEFEVSLFAGGKNVQINYAQVRDLLALQKYKERRAKAKAEAE